MQALVFRKLTGADFFNINKPPGIETRGGGQSYIDFPTSAVKVSDWRTFFKGVPEFQGNNGPGWKFEIHSLGVPNKTQQITIAQRRPASVSIRSQKLKSAKSNRVLAWRPDLTNFPKPEDPSKRSHIYDLHIYIVKLENQQYWAGWFQSSSPEPNWALDEALTRIFSEDDGYLEFKGDVTFDESDAEWPFRVGAKTPPPAPSIPSIARGEESPQEKIMFDEDEINAENVLPQVKQMIRTVRVRNAKAISKLKRLYNNLCQVSGEKFTFKKTDGSFYSEAHHLIPLGKGGADSVYNIVIVSPLIHRMFHFAKVEGLDLKQIKDSTLPIKINGTDYVITWHPDHAKIVAATS